MYALRRTVLALIVLLLTAPASAAFLGENPRPAQNLLDTGIEKVAGDVSRGLPPASGGVWLERTAECFVAPIENPVQGLPRVGSALKTDPYHAFPDVVDNFASGATSTPLQSGATLQQIEGSLNGVAGRFEWIIDNGQVTHRMLVPGGTCNGVPIKP
jgi:hypothetical protein